VFAYDGQEAWEVYGENESRIIKGIIRS